MASENYMRDLVLTELQRAWPDGILVTELQDKTGLGTSDLRATLRALQDDGEAVENSGKVYLEREEGDDETTRPAVRVESAVPVDEREEPAEEQPAAAEAEQPAEGDVEEQPSSPAPAAGDVERDQYRGALKVHVTFTPPAGPFEGDQQPEPDEVARQVMWALQQRVQEAVEATFPDAGVEVDFESLDALKPRRVSLDP